MPSFSLTKKAVADLREIGRYTEQQWGREQRNKYLAQLDACFHQVAGDPLKGSIQDSGRVEMWRGGFGLRFHIPLIEPDMRI